MTYADESAAASQRLLIRAGFPIVRYYLTLTRDLAEPVTPVALPDGLRVETPRTSDLAELLAARNDAFRDHWGSQSSTEETFGRFLGRSTTRLDLSVVARDAAGAIAGFVLVSVNRDDWEAQGFSSAYVDLVGVPRAFRGRRIAPALLTHVLGLCVGEGLQKVVLDVDSESLTGALDLYVGVGFVAGERSMNFTKTV